MTQRFFVVLFACISLVAAGLVALTFFCDRILMLAGGRLVAQGQPEAVITEDHLETYFHIRAKVRWEPDIGGLVVLPCQAITNHE